MSGTSADGVSLVLASFCRERSRPFPTLLKYATYPYPKSLSNLILKGAGLTAAEISRLNIVLGEFFAKAIIKFAPNRSEIQVIGSHGQTIYHGPNDHPRNTLQIGEPVIIAKRTGIPVVSNFRMTDIAAGGSGAPLIPFFDEYFFGSTSRVRALQNIGGIANVTIVGGNRKRIAFDTGPGNCLIDLSVRKITNCRLTYDRGGKLARSGAAYA